MAKIEIGDAQDCNATFKVVKDTTIGGVLYLKGAVADPMVVTLEIMPPDGVKLTYVYGAVGSPIVKVSTGVYTMPILFTQAGTWQVIWTGSGAGSIYASESGGVIVSERPFA